MFKKTSILKCFYFLVFILGLLLLFSNKIQHQIIKINSQNFSIMNFNREEVEKNLKDTNKNVTFDFDAVQPISSEAVLNAQLNQKKKEQYPIIAGISIPSVNLQLPIFIGLDSEQLLWGAGTLSADQRMGEGNYALASHLSYDPEALFSPLQYAEVGEKVYLNDLAYIYEYEIYSKEFVAPEAIHVLDEVPGKTILTLITCGDYEATTRLVVQAFITATKPISQADDSMLAAFN